MLGSEIHVELPPGVADLAQARGLNSALRRLAALRGAELSLGTGPIPGGPLPASDPLPRRQGRLSGRVHCRGPREVRDAADVIADVLEHAIDREEAVENLSEALLGTYEELNLLYGLLPSLAQSVHPSQIAQLLVDETARVVRCRRVCLLALDEAHQLLYALASRGLPERFREVAIPVDAHEAADSALMDKLHFAAEADAPLAHVPLAARGETLGLLVVTDRMDGGDFTARDLQRSSRDSPPSAPRPSTTVGSTRP